MTKRHLGVTSDQVRQAVERLPVDRLEEAWLMLESLFADEAAGLEPMRIPANPEGAFPAIDLNYDLIEDILKRDEADRLSRLLAGI